MRCAHAGRNMVGENCTLASGGATWCTTESPEHAGIYGRRSPCGRRSVDKGEETRVARCIASSCGTTLHNIYISGGQILRCIAHSRLEEHHGIPVNRNCSCHVLSTAVPPNLLSIVPTKPGQMSLTTAGAGGWGGGYACLGRSRGGEDVKHVVCVVPSASKAKTVAYFLGESGKAWDAKSRAVTSRETPSGAVANSPELC